MGRSIYLSFKTIIMCLTMLFPISVWGDTVGLVVDAPSAQITAFEQQLHTMLPNNKIQLISVPQLGSTDVSSVNKWLTLGPSALNQLLKKLKAPKVPILALFLPESARMKLITEYPKSFSMLENAPEIMKQLSLIHALVPQAKKVGVFHSSQFDVSQAELTKQAKRYGLKLHWAELKDPLDWDRSALKILSDVDLVLGVNDDALYNTTTIRSILMRLYRSGKALIGPGKGYVRAGAVASVYSGIEETLAASVSWVKGELPAEDIIKNPYFNISVNAQVARSLNIVVDDVAALTKKVKEGTNER